MKKNVASQVVGAQLIAKADGTPVTAGTTTVYVTGDGGTQATGSVGSGACTHEGQGFWTYAPAQAETNYDHVAFTFVNTSAINATVQTYPSFPQTGDSFARLGTPTGASVSADIAQIRATQSVANAGTAQAGSTVSITLASGASSTDGIYDPGLVRILSGTGVGQARMIIQYVGSTRVASVDRDWRVAPDSTSVYEVIAAANLFSTNEGLATGFTGNSITLNALASSSNNAYVGQTVVLRTGTGQDQSRVVTAYNGSTKVATVGQAWGTNPASGTGYIIWPTGRALVSAYDSGTTPPTAAAIADAVWDEAIAGHAAAGSTGEALSDAGGSGTPPTPAEIADGILARSLAGGADGGRTVQDALRSLRNKSSISGGTLTVCEENDTTTAWTAAVTTTPGDPLSAIDPA